MDRDSTNSVDVSDEIAAFKRSLAGRRDVLKRAYDDVRGHVARTADAIQAAVAAGRPVVPEVDYRTIRDGHVPETTRVAIRRTGCVVVRGVFPVSVASAWFDELGAYLETNRYEEREVEKRSLDLYFSALKAGRPQIFNVYWSKPQVNARQDPKLAETRAFLNRLWRYEGVFDPDRECTYADRVRRRQPGDETLGLSPHMDAGTVERWIDPGFQRVYGEVFAGNWRGYDPFDGAHRLDTREIPSPAVCSMFRTYQGWTALTRQGPQDGTLRLIPIAEGICYVLLRALQEDVPETDLCGAAPGRALGVSPEWHPEHDGGPGLDSRGAAGRHGVLAHRYLPRRRRQARRLRVRERDLHRLRARLPEEPRVSAAAAGDLPRRPIGARFRPDGFRGRFRRQGH